MNKSILWVHRLGPVIASFRYRTQIPAEEVAKHNGFRTFVNEGEGDIIVFSKPIAEDVESARKAKELGAKVVVDLCDDNFGTEVAETYREMAKVADAVVTATPTMRARLFDYTGRDAAVLPDPYEQPEVEPHADGDNYLWFGHLRNFPELVRITHILGERKVRIVTGPKEIPNTIPWSPQNMTKAFAMSNIVLLPTQQGSEYKSANRLINSLRAGCFAVCMTHPAYLEFKHFVWVGHFPTGLRWTEAFRSELNDRVREGQDYIRDRYSPAAVGAQWASFLESL